MQRKLDNPQINTRIKTLARSTYTNIARAYDVLADRKLTRLTLLCCSADSLICLARQRQQYDEEIGLAPPSPDANDNSCDELDERHEPSPQIATGKPEIFSPLGRRRWMSDTDPWKVLQISSDADEREIEDAYNAFHDKFLSNRHNLSAAELIAAQARLTEKRRAVDFLLDREC